MSIYSGQDFIIADESELWIKPTINSYPLFYFITFIERLNDTTIILLQDEPLTLYLGDVLLFETTLVVIAETFTFNVPILDEFNTLVSQPTIVKVLPLIDNIPVGTIAPTYALTPVYSFGTHSVNSDGNTVTRNDKELGVWTKHFTTTKTCDIPCSGHMIKDDVGFHLLYDTAQTSRFIYFELRYHPYVDTNIGTAKGIASVHLSDSSNPLEFVDVNFTLKIRGKFELYTPLNLKENLYYCPFNYTSYYKLDFKTIPEEDITNYCLQDTTGWYDFLTEP